ncbi:glutathione S-transferase [Roseiarcus fermentans]|uniref:Glutathione S-transferase n=1 Tax=Roseiarcus fermentans TaxID=1473586 RepID=A0A366FBM3_9HYPH|nr:glutathione S-transferase [Roseiarcus fermentans]RBP11149.1 glutathione S-transferase [Roseiarcus fermentans]
MKLYNSNFAPNPRRVRVFLAEKGVAIPRIEVDLAKLEQKAPEYSAVNPFQVIPALELDGGEVIGESIAICRYIEELHPEPNLFGATPLERAMVEMWQRRVEWHLLLPIAQAFRHSHPAMTKMEDPQIPDWAAANRTRALRNMMIFDRMLADRPFVAGDRFTVADITGLVALDFARPARIAIPPELGQLSRWHETLKARPSAAA